MIFEPLLYNNKYYTTILLANIGANMEALERDGNREIGEKEGG